MNSVWILVVILGIASLYPSFAQIPCDEAYGQHCPEASGYEVGECLKKLDDGILSQECKDYIQWHDVCRSDLDNHCNGKEYTGDALGI